MNNKLQFSLSASTDVNPGHSLEASPILIPIPDEVVPALRAAIATVDQTDAHPNDGAIQEVFHKRFPVRINLFLFKINQNVSVDAELTVELV